ncbi:hypothetical protein EKH55_0084 [Sinorhizobium alkalisoli]|nr:hypothetical protein EKH55_0084 [Sinorhizobium alkalisoli]
MPQGSMMARSPRRMKTFHFDTQDFIKTAERQAGYLEPFLRSATLK